MTRRESREAALKYVFEQEFDAARTPEEIIETACEERGDENPSAFARELFFAVSGHRGDFDEKIAAAADNWRIDRISKVALAVLRLACAEFYCFPEIPVEITVNEALELARRYADEKSVPFVNGVLGKLAAGLEKPQAKHKPDKAEEQPE
ncbi:MAG: transcription antitermination factor NusB [Clostridia bacterium]|nr:transcription antitermination factor NusB [Clostridia bacterium]